MLWMWLKRVGCLNEWLVFKIENLYAKQDGLNVTHRHTKSILHMVKTYENLPTQTQPFFFFEYLKKFQSLSPVNFQSSLGKLSRGLKENVLWRGQKNIVTT